MNQRANKKKRNPLDFLVGFIVLYVLMAIFTGPDGAVFILWYSILCTAGTSLVIWIPLAYVIGKLVRSIYKRDWTSTIPQRPNLAANRHEALQKYVEEASGRGVSQLDITALLTKNGWSLAEINETAWPGRG